MANNDSSNKLIKADYEETKREIADLKKRLAAEQGMITSQKSSKGFAPAKKAKKPFKSGISKRPSEPERDKNNILSYLGKKLMYIAKFHWVDTFAKYLESKVILGGSERIVRKFYLIRYAIGIKPGVLDALIDYMNRWTARFGRGKIKSMVVAGAGDIKPLLVKGVVQEILRPIYWKLKNKDKGFFEFKRAYRGMRFTAGGCSIADLIMEDWPSIKMPLFGELMVEIYPSQTDYDALKSHATYGPVITKLEESNFRDFEAAGFIEAVEELTKIPLFNYQDRQILHQLPCIGDLFFYHSYGTDYVYILNSSEWNRLTLAFNVFLNTHVIDKDGTPIGSPYPTLVRTVTINPDGSETVVEVLEEEKVNLDNTDVDSAALRGTYEWYDTWNIDNLQESFWYIFIGNNDQFPELNLGWKGTPTDGSGSSGPVTPSPGGPSGPVGPESGNPSEPPTSEPYIEIIPNIPRSPDTGNEPNMMMDFFVERLSRVRDQAGQLITEGIREANQELIRQGREIERDTNDLFDHLFSFGRLLPGYAGIASGTLGTIYSMRPGSRRRRR